MMSFNYLKYNLKKLVFPSLLSVVASISILGYTPSAVAEPPYLADLVQGGNRWILNAYDDTDVDHNALATVGLCFKYDGFDGTHERYTWYSDTFLGWRGIASQEGDQIFMTGMYADGEGRDAIQVEIIIDAPRSGSVGHWQEWRDNGGYGLTVGYANARMIRDVGKSCLVTEDEALGSGFFFSIFPPSSENPMTYIP